MCFVCVTLKGTGYSYSLTGRSFKTRLYLNIWPEDWISPNMLAALLQDTVNPVIRSFIICKFCTG